VVLCCRQLSYEGAEFELRMIQLDDVFQVQYSRAAAFWQLMAMVVGKGGCFTHARKRLHTMFWGDHQRFFKSMLMAAKVPALAHEARQSVVEGHSVVIGLQSTGEANMHAEQERQGECACLVSLPHHAPRTWCLYQACTARMRHWAA
jgi:hypothetical protein